MAIYLEYVTVVRSPYHINDQRWEGHFATKNKEKAVDVHLRHHKNWARCPPECQKWLSYNTHISPPGMVFIVQCSNTKIEQCSNKIERSICCLCDHYSHVWKCEMHPPLFKPRWPVVSNRIRRGIEKSTIIVSRVCIVLGTRKQERCSQDWIRQH
jgi:hypothetical protein